MKSTEKPNRMPMLILIFIISCVVLQVLGGVVCGIEIMTGHGISGFLNVTVPSFLGRTVGLPYSESGVWFTLASSLFLLVMSLLLYTAYSGEELTDFSHAPESAISRLLHFIFSFILLEEISYSILDPAYYGNCSIFSVAIFAIYAFVGAGGSSEDDTTLQKFFCRLLSSFGFVVGVAGVSSVIMNNGLASILVPPSAIAQWFAALAANYATTWTVVGVMLLIAVVLAVVVVGGLALAIKNGPELTMTSLPACLFFLGGFLHYAKYSADYTNIQACAYWVMVLVSVSIWAIASHYRILVLFGSIAAIIGVGSLYYTFTIFYAPINDVLTALSQWLNPIYAEMFNKIAGFVNHEFAAAIIIMVVGLGIVLIASIPTYNAGDKLKIPGNVILVLSKVFLCGVVLRFMDSSWLPWSLNGISYFLMAASAVGLIVLLFCYLAVRDVRGAVHCIGITVMTGLMGGYFALFAPIIGIIAFAVLICLTTFGTIGAFSNYRVSEEEQRQQARRKAHDALDQALEDGADSREVSRERHRVDFFLGKGKGK